MKSLSAGLEKTILFADIWKLIFTFLTITELKSVRLVCKYFYELVKESRSLSYSTILEMNADDPTSFISKHSNKFEHVDLKSLGLSLLPHELCETPFTACLSLNLLFDPMPFSDNTSKMRFLEISKRSPHFHEFIQKIFGSNVGCSFLKDVTFSELCLMSNTISEFCKSFDQKSFLPDSSMAFSFFLASKQFPSIRELNITAIERKDPPFFSLGIFLDAFRFLTTLSMKNLQFPSGPFYESIQRLSLENCEVTEVLEGKNFPSLVEMSVSNCHQLGEKLIVNVERFPKLKVLKVYQIDLCIETEISFPLLADMKLRELRVLGMVLLRFKDLILPLSNSFNAYDVTLLGTFYDQFLEKIPLKSLRINDRVYEAVIDPNSSQAYLKLKEKFSPKYMHFCNEEELESFLSSPVAHSNVRIFATEFYCLRSLRRLGTACPNLKELRVISDSILSTIHHFQNPLENEKLWSTLTYEFKLLQKLERLTFSNIALPSFLFRIIFFKLPKLTHLRIWHKDVLYSVNVQLIRSPKQLETWYQGIIDGTEVSSIHFLGSLNCLAQVLKERSHASFELSSST
jgi:hypothetical protein